MRVYSAGEVHAALPWDGLVAALERAFVAGASVPRRHAHPLTGDGPDGTLLLMPAWNRHVVVVKTVTVLPGADRTVRATVLALDRTTGEPLAMLDGDALTVRRTAATSALAAVRLAREDASTLLIVGTGRLAPWMARAHAAMRPFLTRVLVWGRRPEAATALAQELAGEGLPAAAVPALEPAVRESDIVCCVTTATEPVVHGAWIALGTHLDLVGGFRPHMREVDDAAVQGARVVVDGYAGALSEAGDLTQTLASGAIARAHVLADLAEVLRREARVRRGPRDITLFKSVGLALEDLAAAQLILERAR